MWYLAFCFQVKKFLVYFRNMINEGVTYEILNLYENTFPKLTEQYFENTPWPDENEVAPVVDSDHVSSKIDSSKNIVYFVWIDYSY